MVVDTPSRRTTMPEPRTPADAARDLNDTDPAGDLDDPR